MAKKTKKNPKTTPQLERDLAAARDRLDIAATRQIELQLLIRRVMGNAIVSPVIRVLRDTERLSLEIAESSMSRSEKRQRLTSLYLQTNNELQKAMRMASLSASDQIHNEQVATLDSILTVAQKRAATGLPIDATGQVRPQAIKTAGIVSDDMSLERIIIAALPLLAVAGIRAFSRNPVETLVESVNAMTSTFVHDEAPRFPQLIKSVVIPVRDTVTVLLDAAKKNLPLLPFLRRVFGLRGSEPGTERIGEPGSSDVGGRGVARQAQNVLRHQMIRLYNESLDNTRNSSEIFAGYVLRSMFLSSTDPIHANNDGNHYYKDNRAASAAKWKKRLIPPYRTNCVCFTVDILNDDFGDEHYVTWRITDIPGMEKFEPRDVGTWATWFGDQRESVQRKLLGDRRWEAADASWTGGVRYEHVVRPDGRFMSANSIATEGFGESRERAKAVRDLMKRTSETNREALAAGKGQWELTDTQEFKYQQRLAAFMRRLEQ